MLYSTRPCVVIDLYTSVVCYVMHREYRNNMVSVEVDADCSYRKEKLDKLITPIFLQKYYLKYTRPNNNLRISHPQEIIICNKQLQQSEL